MTPAPRHPMSRDIALRNIGLEPASRWGHTEYSLGYHPEYLARKTGLGAEDPAFAKAWHRALIMDLGWNTNDGLVDWRSVGRVTDMGHAVYAADGSDQRAPHASPFASEEEVWAFDAVEEYGLPGFEEQVRAYEAELAQKREDYPDRLTTGGYYKTIASGAIAAFGWEMFLLAGSDTDKLEHVLDSFFRRTLFFMKAWAATSAEVVIQHDDFVWTSGPFLHPDVYRCVIIPRYAELWKPLREAGKKVLFCSDGNFM